MRLIDADVLLAKLREIGNEPDYQHNGEDWGVGICIAETEVENALTIGAVPVKRVRWFCGEYDTPRCSECLSGALLDGSEDYVKSKYCPNCGALMDGGEHD